MISSYALCCKKQVSYYSKSEQLNDSSMLVCMMVKNTPAMLAISMMRQRDWHKRNGIDSQPATVEL